MDLLHSQAHELHPDDPNKFEVVAPEEWAQNENLKVEILCGRAWVVMEPDKPVVMRQKVVPKLIWHGNWLVRAKFLSLACPCLAPRHRQCRRQLGFSSKTCKPR